MKLLTSFAASAVVSATMLVAPLAAMAQERIAVGSVNGSTIYLDEIMAVAQTLPPNIAKPALPTCTASWSTKLPMRALQLTRGARTASMKGRTSPRR